LKGLHPLKKKGMAFGSYGWSGEATKIIETEMKAMGIEILEPELGLMYVPGEEELLKCTQLGERIAAGL
jgi:flavorubredoxin